MRKILLTFTLLLLSPHLWAADIDFDKLKGKVVYLDFWASWCGPCRNSFPWMEQMQQRYGDKGLKIIAVNLDQEPQLAKKFLQQFPVDFEIQYDPKGDMAEKFGVQTMPTSFLINRDGKAVKKHNGFFKSKSDEYESEIASLLGGNP